MDIELVETLKFIIDRYEGRMQGSVFSPFKYDNNTRCDLHPRWNRKGDKICIDSIHEGKRGLYTLAVSDYISDIKNSLFISAEPDQPCNQISFVIPVYNAESTIERCLNSLLNQTDNHWEAIIINDGSTDNTENILKNYLTDKRFKLITQINSGPGLARNKGIQESCGDYISFLDSDDYLEQDFVSLIRKRIQFTQADIIFYETVYEKENGKFIRTSRIFSYADNSKIDFITRQLAGTFSWAANKVVKKNVVNKSGAEFTGQNVGEESLFTFNILRFANRIEFVKEPIYHYVQSDYGQHNSGGEDPLYDACISMKKFMENNNLLDTYNVALNCMAYKAVSMSLYRIAINNSLLSSKKKMKNQIKKYKNEFNLKTVDQTKLNKSAKFLLPFVLHNRTLFIYFASVFRKRRKSI